MDEDRCRTSKRRHYGNAQDALHRRLTIGCSSQTLLTWVKRQEIDSDKREGLTTSERDELKRLQRENKELRRANDILRTASAFFAQAEFDRKFKL